MFSLSGRRLALCACRQTFPGCQQVIADLYSFSESGSSWLPLLCAKRVQGLPTLENPPCQLAALPAMCSPAPLLSTYQRNARHLNRPSALSPLVRTTWMPSAPPHSRWRSCGCPSCRRSPRRQRTRRSGPPWTRATSQVGWRACGSDACHECHACPATSSVLLSSAPPVCQSPAAKGGQHACPASQPDDPFPCYLPCCDLQPSHRIQPTALRCACLERTQPASCSRWRRDTQLCPPERAPLAARCRAAASCSSAPCATACTASGC